MTDLELTPKQAVNVKRKLVDNGDGTYSELFSVTPDLSGATFGDVTVEPAAASNATSGALEKSRVIKASAGTLYRLSGYNSNVAAQYVQVFDAASLPANGSTPLIVFQVGGGESFDRDFGLRGRAFANGIVVCSSSTLATKTLGAASDMWFDAQYA